MRLPEAASIKLLAMDVDGVLTQGDIIYSSTDEEIKAFNIQDGLGLAVARHAGLLTAIVTGRASHAVQRRSVELGITEVCQGVRFKSCAIKMLMEKYSLQSSEIAFIGDDINDIPAFAESGLRIAVNNASIDLKKHSNYITEKNGGCGAVREVIEIILGSQDKWDTAVKSFLRDLEQTECKDS
ncbi:MAG: KdsC family phosphatase [Armatimonadota bacterium]